MHHLQLHPLQLPPRSHEDAQVDAQHEQQGHQHTAKEVEVDHVVHGDYLLKKALDGATRALRSTGAVGELGVVLWAVLGVPA